MKMEALQIFSFGVVATAISVLVVYVYKTVLCGKRCAEAGGEEHISRHKRIANHTILSTLFLLVSIEAFSYFSPVHATGIWIFTVHMFFAIPFLLMLLVLRFWATGIHKRNIHKPLAYAAALSFVGVLGTGVFMQGSERSRTKHAARDHFL